MMSNSLASSCHDAIISFFGFQMYFPVHVQLKWKYPGLLFNNSFVFYTKFFAKLSPNIKATFKSIFWNSCLNFGLIFGMYDNFITLLKQLFLLFFFFIVWYLRTKFSKNDLLCPISTKHELGLRLFS